MSLVLALAVISSVSAASNDTTSPTVGQTTHKQTTTPRPVVPTTTIPVTTPTLQEGKAI
jgi:hypothetical protein